MMQKRSLRIVHSIPHYLPDVRGGGVVPFVRNLSEEQRSMGHEVRVVTTRAASMRHVFDAPSELEVGSVPVSGYPRLTSVGHGVSIPLWRAARDLVSDVDVLHVHGLFSAANAILLRAARREQKAAVVSPHGSCMEVALSFGRYRKLAFLSMIGRRQLREAAVHVTSELEAESVRRFTSAAHVFIVPPGAPAVSSEVSPPRDPNQVLFLGRYHPIKGFELLLEAMSRARKKLPRAELVIAGLSPRQEHQIAEQATRLDPRPRLWFRGFVEGREKSSLLGSVAGLVLTSESESFGQVVLEALRAGTPVITTKRSPWAQLEAQGAGWWVDHEANAVADAVVELLSEGGRDRSSAARALADAYSWPRAAEAFDIRYRSIM